MGKQSIGYFNQADISSQEQIEFARECFTGERVLYSSVIKALTNAQAGFKALDPEGKKSEKAMRGAFVKAVISNLREGKISQRGFDLFVHENHSNPLVEAAFPVPPHL